MREFFTSISYRSSSNAGWELCESNGLRLRSVGSWEQSSKARRNLPLGPPVFAREDAHAVRRRGRWRSCSDSCTIVHLASRLFLHGESPVSAGALRLAARFSLRDYRRHRAHDPPFGARVGSTERLRRTRAPSWVWHAGHSWAAKLFRGVMSSSCRHAVTRVNVSSHRPRRARRSIIATPTRETHHDLLRPLRSQSDS